MRTTSFSIPVICLSILLILAMISLVASADPLTVQTQVIQEETSYEVERTYAGQLANRRASMLGFEFGGVIAVIHRDEGDEVAAGDVLASLDASALQAQVSGAGSDVATARANLSSQKAQLALSRATLKRQEDLAKTGHASAQRLDELRMQHRVDQSRMIVLQTQLQASESRLRLQTVNLAKTELVAPYDGVLQARLADEGSIVSPGQTILEIVEQRDMEARVRLPAEVSTMLDPNRSYEFKVNQKAVPGRLKTVLPKVDPMTGTVTAIFSLDHDNLFAGSLVEMKLGIQVPERGYWVPLNALAESQRGLWSLLVVEDNRVAARLVEILYRGADRVFVRGTLNNGDEVISTGTSRIVPGQEVTIAARRNR